MVRRALQARSTFQTPWRHGVNQRTPVLVRVGAGSSPCDPPGRQRENRASPIHSPAHAPCRLTHWAQYSEQVGV
jgi:hypothetical protein